jgi:uncharacterized membrane protein AbrB (regulator of aidB expression)
MIKELIEILKFKITIFMSIIGGATFLAINIEKISFMPKMFVEIIIFLVLVYGVAGFMYNMFKLSEIQKDLQ